MKVQEITLNRNWQWKQRDTSLSAVLDELNPPAGEQELINKWNDAHAFPSEIHIELMKVGQIPDPYVGFNEHKVQWVGDREWLYKSTFAFDRNNGDQHTELEFEGLDTFCDVYLNGKLILSTDNQFRSYAVTLNPATLQPSDNILLLHFKSAKQIAKTIESQFRRVRAGSINLGDPSRVYVRKAQYDWRWDWGPELMTCGPYRPIKLVTYSTRISSIYTRAHVSPSSPTSSSSLKVNLSLSGDISKAHTLRLVLRGESGGQDLKPIRSEDVRLTKGSIVGELRDVVSWEFKNGEVDLWWPVGYGGQTLYVLEILLLGDNEFLLDQQTKRIGFRDVQLIQEALKEPDQYGTGTTFLFQVNGVRIFIGGSNWVPADSFLTTITSERYRAWLTLLKEGNQNMVRIWGGGVYEPDVFYDTCDELGILVWQDFQFACGVYPAHDEFVANVRAEAEDNVKRLRHHPSLALLCGNNEDYQQVLQWGGITELPARKIYEEVLPEVVSRLTDPEIPYHRGSPYGGKEWDTADPTVGDVHQWNIWAGELPWQDYERKGGRFVSEFGIPSMPDMKTIKYWLDGDESQAWPQSKLMAQHCKAGGFERRFAVIMNENFRLTSDLETHAFNTQILQSEAVGFAYRIWRRDWRGQGKEYTAGVIVWQLNDCWPVTSWAIVDYFLRPKPAFYTVAREMRAITVGVARIVTKNRDNDRPKQFYEFGAFQSRSATIDVWGTNSRLSSRSVKLELNCVDINPGSNWSHKVTREVVLFPNQSTELLSIPCPCPPAPAPATKNEDSPATTSYSVVVSARLLDPKTGEVIARYADWPQPFRHVDFPQNPGLKITVEGESVRVSAEKPVKALVLSVDGDGGEVKWSDNALDIMPGDEQMVIAKGLQGRNIKIAHLGKEKAKAV
ncbi:glycoside hydrolase family 2 protein [Jaapia argillacea MUCL 33604]|uniref:Beta-mannosidase B n=1 Tax=Jaapia argillacea MUCL 33604 TaxID=933084 RepID=A0A067P9H8_9AGAM|nr:glycoside hydrolase family 2 protein [Jaapia argillacea MUCL 33604]